MSSHYYLAGSWVPIHTILVGLLGSISTTLVSSVGWKVLEEVYPLRSGTTGVAEFLSFGSPVELMMVVASS